MKFILIADKEGAQISFFPLWEVICFVLIITAILVALFPRHLLKKVLAYNQPSAVSIGYLEGFEKRYPQNTQILMTLIQQEAQLGQITQAQNNVTYLKKMKIAPGPAMSAQFRWTDYLILRFKYYHASNNKIKKDELLQQLRTTAKALASEPLTVEQLKTLAKDNLAYNQAAVSLEIIQELMDTNKLTTPEEFALGGNIAMQNNEQRASANFYMGAYNISVTMTDKRKYAREVIKVLWAGNFLHEALGFVDSLPDAVIDDRDLLLYIAQLAMAANHPEIAQKYALKALLYEHHGRHE